MPDLRFYEALAPASLTELASLTGAEVAGGDGGLMVAAAAPLSRADDRAVSFLADRRHMAQFGETRAAACFVLPAQAAAMPAGVTALLTDEPQAAYAKAALRLHRPRRHDPSAPAVHPTAVFEDDVQLGHGVVVGPGARVGSGTQIGAYAVIGPGVCIGRDCVIGANVTLGFALIGDRVRIASGAVIGEAGFGVAGSAAGALDIPQLGRVILQDGVTVGACTCIDRGAWDDTVVGENTKIDNLVQIAHNCRLGRNCLLAGHVGLAGSVTVGDGAVFGGRAGVSDHVTIGTGARVAAAAGVMRDVPAGETWGGAPARPIRTFMRETAWLARRAASKPEGSGGKLTGETSG